MILNPEARIHREVSIYSRSFSIGRKQEIMFLSKYDSLAKITRVLNSCATVDSAIQVIKNLNIGG